MDQPRPATTDGAPEKETGRLEAFSDGVLAVIITIMVLELHSPTEGNFHALRHSLPGLLIYVLSFVFIGIYWNNHHHLLRAARSVSGQVMWANLHLLFWLSLIPAVTEWVGKAHNDTAPAATYAIVALASAIAYTLLVIAIVRTEGPQSKVDAAIGRDVKGRVSIAIYAAAIGLSFVDPWICYALLVTVAVIWFIPDRRLER
jgi:uncharacterized membrane protein